MSNSFKAIFLLCLSSCLLPMVRGAGGAQTYEIDGGKNFGAFISVIIFATLGGWIVNFIWGTSTPSYAKPCGCQKFFKGYIHSWAMPALVGQLVMGIIARNCWGDIMNYYPDDIAGWCRQMAMAILMLIGGMELQFEGRGGVMLMMTFMPLVWEVFGFTICGIYMLDMNLSMAITVGMVLGAVSPGVLIPILIKLKEGGYGMKKGIPYLIIGAASFDDIVAITGFMVAMTFGLNEFSDVIKPVGDIIVQLVIQVVVGTVSGLVMGFIVGYPLKKQHVLLKFIVSAFVVCVLVALHYKYHLLAGEFLTAIIFGYVCFRFWGHTKPEHELEQLWGICTPFLFGTIGACLDFQKMNQDLMGTIIGCIIIACVWRTLAAYFSVYESQYSWKEKLFCAIAWLPKGSVNAVVGGMLADQALTMNEGYGRDQVAHYGDISLTAALISIIITAPVGGIAAMLLGPIMLDKETEEEKKEREMMERDCVGEEEWKANQEAEEKNKGTTMSKTLGTNPNMMIARSMSNRSHYSKRSGKSREDARKASLDRINKEIKAKQLPETEDRETKGLTDINKDVQLEITDKK